MRRLRLFLVSGMLAFALVPGLAVAQRVDVSDDVCTGSARNSAFCKDADAGGATGSDRNPIFGPDGFLTSIINFLSIIVGIVAVFSIIFAGLRYITSGANPQEVSNSREIILYALVAVIIAALAQVLVRFFLSKIG